MGNHVTDTGGGCARLQDCQRHVYFCDTAESVEQRILAGDCITVPQRVTNSVRRELTEYVSGTGMKSDVYRLWGERIFRRLDGDADSDRWR